MFYQKTVARCLDDYENGVNYSASGIPFYPSFAGNKEQWEMQSMLMPMSGVAAMSRDDRRHMGGWL